MAARGAGAAGQDTAEHRLPGREHVVELDPLDQRLRAAFSRAALDRWAHGDDRISLGRGTVRSAAGARHRTGATPNVRNRRDPRLFGQAVCALLRSPWSIATTAWPLPLRWGCLRPAWPHPSC